MVFIKLTMGNTMKTLFAKKTFLTVIAANLFLLAGCQESADAPADMQETAAAEPEKSAEEFIAGVNKRYKEETREYNAAQWVYNTYINEDSGLLATEASERLMAMEKEVLSQARKYKGAEMDPVTAKAYSNLTSGKTLLPPDTPERRAELAALATKMEGAYGAGKYCKQENGEEVCRNLIELSKVLAENRNYDELLDAWVGWRTVSPAYREDYTKFIEIANTGAQAYGFDNLGASWKSGYDMSPDEFEAEVERLWSQVEPLYKSLHCKVRADLAEHYGEDKVPLDQPIPAHLLGNMWSQQWGEIFDLVQPYPGVGDLDITGALKEQDKDAVEITRIAEQFFVSLGMEELPGSFWEKSMLTKPLDREVVCHASAWQMDGGKDVRIKQCIEPTEEEFQTVHHELGHIYYYLAYDELPMLFQSGAHDGFHEAIGDTVSLSITPGYLKEIGLIDETVDNQQAVINQQMKLALDKIAFLPFGKLIDQWRWKVYSGEIKPEDYNKAWWDLRTQYQGIEAPVARSENDFDPGAKYHIPANVPYTRYFLAHILQFQFHKALCDAAGHEGPLYQCSIYNSKEAGEKLYNLLAAGASKPWQDVLEQAIGTREMDGSAIVEYFAPLAEWLETENQGRQCGW